MDPVNGLNQIMQILRQRLSGGRSTERAGKAQTKSQSSVQQQAPHRSSKSSPDEVIRRIGERIRQLTPEDKRGGKATQIFVESVLVWEFGEDLLQDPKFTEIANEVQQAIDSNEAARQKLTQLLNQL